ncbi:DUF6541 family protein [Pedococcus sp. NPDC057267]|uniref:DUF6541 family protein n=1 Tax=Pedococcus sp. NPDC057267 TaxID=3346077 RepID=UPI003637775D
MGGWGGRPGGAARRPRGRRPRPASTGGDGRSDDPGRRGLPWWTTLAGLVPAALVAGHTWLKGTSGLRTVNQDWDIPWHANMVRLIADSRAWDPHVAGHFAYYDTALANAPVRSYPIALHAELALVWPASGLDIPTFINAFVLVLVTLQLPLSTMALASVVTRRPVAVAAAGAISPWLAVYPWDLLWRGPLIPFFAGMLAVGPFVALAVVAARHRQWGVLPAVAVAAVALVAVHPSLAFVAAPLLVCWWAGRLLARRDDALRSGLYLLAAAVLAAALGLPVVREMVQEAGRVATVSWAPDSSALGAVRNLLFLTHGSRLVYVAPLLAVAALVRFVTRPRTAWYLLPLALYAGLAWYTMSSTSGPPWFTAPFYDDQWRLLAVFTMLAVPILGIGVDVVAAGASTAVTLLVLRRGRRPAPLGDGASEWYAGGDRATAATGLVVLVALAAVSLPDVAENSARLTWANKTSGATLSSHSARLMSQLGRWVPASEQVLADPCQGSVWMYALGDRMPVIRHFEVLPTQRQELVLDHFRDMATDPAVRSAAAELDIGWVFVSGGKIRPWDHARPGLTDPSSLPFLQLVARDGDASLYRLDWNRLPGGGSALAAAAGRRVAEPGVPGPWSSREPSAVAPKGHTC